VGALGGLAQRALDLRVVERCGLGIEAGVGDRRQHLLALRESRPCTNARRPAASA
jgi:hypothetical protein